MRVGDVLGERFELIEEVRAGGMGTVFRARDRASSKTVAVKVLRTELEEDVARFTTEARVLADLAAIAGVVGYVAHDLPEGGGAFLAMEWLEGRDLRQHLNAHGPLAVGDVVRLGARLAATLDQIHARGLVHRDLKPSNVFLVGDRVDDATLIDFGVVRRANVGESTKTGILVGTPAYMAPEQARGDKDIDGRADLFALGCLLYACLAGRAPFSGESVVAVLTKIILEQPRPIEDVRVDVPAPLASLVGRLLQKDRDRRLPDARAVREALAMVAVDAVHARPAPTSIHPSLGLSEQRFLTLLLCRSSAEAPLARIGLEAHEAAVSLGAQIARLIDGSLVAWIETGAATDQASNAALLALSLRAHVGTAPMAIATARGVVAERLPVGPVIDRAADLAARAPHGSVVLDEVTSGLLDDRFDVRITDGVAALLGQRESTQGQRTLLGKPTPCVGRERELAALTALFDECAEEGTARAVLVVGEAGIGKTRIRHELLQRLREARADADVWTARGDSLSAGSPFALVRRALRGAMGAREGDALAAQSVRLASFVGARVGADVDQVGEFIGEIVGVPVSTTPSAQLLAARANAVLMGDQLRSAFEALIVAECKKRPLVLVLEDLHWGDLPTVRLVEGALRAARGLPLFVLALARPEVHDRFPRLWEEQGLSVIHVAGLARKAAARLVRAALGDVDDALVDKLVERAGGHAFTLEELVRAASSRGGAELPETVLAMMQRRLDEIAPEPRRVLRAASVFGASFWSGGLAELVGRRGEATLSQTLSALSARELVQRRAESRFRGDEEWTFRHALLREAVYGTLTDDDRRLGHMLAGVWLVRAGERDAVMIAEHFERGGDRARAAEWYLRAAERALAGNDWKQTIESAERGLVLGGDTEVRGALQLTIAQACTWSGDVRRAEREAVAAASLLERGTGPWFDAVADAINAAGMGLGHGDVARDWVDALFAAWDTREDPYAAAIAAARALTPMLLAGDRPRASKLAELLEASDLSGSPLAEAHRFRARASWAFRGQQDLGAYVELTHASLERFVAAGDARSAALQRTSHGYGLTLLGAPESESVLREGIIEAARVGLPLQAATHQQNLGLVLARVRRFSEAIAIERASIAAFRDAGDKRFEAASHVYLSNILEGSGDFDAAEAEAHVAIDMSSSYAARRATALGALAAARLGRGDANGALEAASRAMEIVDQLGALEEGEEKLRLTLGATLAALGRQDESGAVLRDARRRLEERAAKIQDPRWRASFLENVPENVALRSAI